MHPQRIHLQQHRFAIALAYRKCGIDVLRQMHMMALALMRDSITHYASWIRFNALNNAAMSSISLMRSLPPTEPALNWR